MLVVRRYYASSKANKNCKRRITTLVNIPTHFDFPKESLQYSLVEYIGKCTATLQHGNAKLRQAPYVRSHPKVHENIRDALQKKKRPRDIYIDMLQNDDVHQTAKRIRQIHDAKKQMKEKESGGQRASTFADEVQQVLSMMDDPASVVQYVFFAKSKSPCFILYTPQCMASLKSNCFRTIAPSILGIDKTFNLGKVFVSVLSYKCTGVVNQSSCNPIVLGPLLLHGDSSSNVYGGFLNHIATHVGFQNIQI